MATFDDDLLSEEDSDNIDNDNEGDDNVDESFSDNEEMKKKLKIGKKGGRRAQWEDQHVNDFIETICENEYFRRKLIFTNNEPQKNKEVCDIVIKKLYEKYKSNFPFSVKQIQIKFKNCVSQCKKVIVLQKTASGVKTFVQNKGLGQWFMPLYQLVSYTDSC